MFATYRKTNNQDFRICNCDSCFYYYDLYDHVIRCGMQHIEKKFNFKITDGDIINDSFLERLMKSIAKAMEDSHKVKKLQTLAGLAVASLGAKVGEIDTHTNNILEEDRKGSHLKDGNFHLPSYVISVLNFVYNHYGAKIMTLKDANVLNTSDFSSDENDYYQ